MIDFLVGLSMVFFIEGILFALFPEGMKRYMAQVLIMPLNALRSTGIIAALIGLVFVWLLRG